jgi:tRNA A37 threonylcarbamoyladenosine modification protein TsaB
MGLAKGLALALGRPIVGVPSLDAWLDADPLARAAVARAGAREAYVLFRGEPEPHVVDRDLLPPEMATDRVVAPAELAAALGLGGAVSPVGGAAAIARRAAQRLATDRAGDDLARLEPAYLRAPRGVRQISDAEIVRWP